jgi:glycosyltransferase involved in cell wall biosynthesis
MQEQILLLAKAFRAEGGSLVPCFSESPSEQVQGEYARADLLVEHLDLTSFSWRHLRTLIRLIKENQTECMHWNFYPALVNPYIWWLSVLTPAVAHVLTEHNSLPLDSFRSDRWLRATVKRMMLKRYRRLWCVSRFVKDFLEEHRGWRGVRAITLFINTERFRPDSQRRQVVREEMSIESEWVGVVVAQLVRAKGVDIALRAIAELPDSVYLWVIGEGPDRQNLEQLCQDLGIEERVRFLGNQLRVEPYLQAADCLICPSRWAEAAGFVNLEAQACGLPVIASRVGGIPEYVQDGRTGILFGVGKYRELAACIARLQNDPVLLRKMSDEARRFSVDTFSSQRRIGEYLDRYRTVMRNRRSNGIGW